MYLEILQGPSKSFFVQRGWLQLTLHVRILLDLAEHLDILVERESRSADSYRKAMKSLRLCPIAFDHPDETQSLAGIGPSIAAT
jgi:hypothetical protein